jgi:uroporphyrinogen-III synthase
MRGSSSPNPCGPSWQQVRPGDRVLIVRGASLHSTTDSQGSGREWLSSQLRSLGAQVELVGVYSRQCPAATPALQERLAAHCAARDLWLFSSSEAIAHLQQLLPRTGLEPPARWPPHPHRRHGTRRGLAMFWNVSLMWKVCLRR